MDKKTIGLIALLGAGALAFYFLNKTFSLNKTPLNADTTAPISPQTITPVLVTPTVITQPQPNLTSIYAPAQIYNPITTTTTTTIIADTPEIAQPAFIPQTPTPLFDQNLRDAYSKTTPANKTVDLIDLAYKIRGLQT